MNGVRSIPAPVPPRNKNGEASLSDAPLSAMLDYVAKKNVTIIDDDNVKKVLRKFRNSPGPSSLSMLNSLIHNEEFCLDKKEAKDLWLPLERLFIIMLSKPGANNGHVQDTVEISRREKRSS